MRAADPSLLCEVYPESAQLLAPKGFSTSRSILAQVSLLSAGRLLELIGLLLEMIGLPLPSTENRCIRAAIEGAHPCVLSGCLRGTSKAFETAGDPAIPSVP
jgi:hypothetical protein